MTSVIAALALTPQLFTVAPPPSRVSNVWVIDLDTTASQSSGQYEQLARTIDRRLWTLVALGGAGTSGCPPCRGR